MNKLLNKTEQQGDCKIWVGQKDRWGYGKVKLKINGIQKTVGAHRYAYKLANGEIPEGLFVCHKCDNPACVEVTHLFLGSHDENMRDMVLKGRSKNQNRDKTHCKNGHPLEGDNLYSYVLDDGKIMRQCLTCRKNRTRKFRLNDAVLDGRTPGLDINI